MSQTLKVLAVLLGAAFCAALAPVVVGMTGFYACKLVAWTTGNEQFMGYMWLVVPLAILAAPAGLVGGALLGGRLVDRLRPGAGTDAGEGFPSNGSHHGGD